MVNLLISIELQFQIWLGSRLGSYIKSSTFCITNRIHTYFSDAVYVPLTATFIKWISSVQNLFYLKQQSKSKMCSFSSLQNKAEHKLRNVLWRMYTGRLVLAGLTKPKPRVWDNRWWWWFSIFSIKPGFLLQDHAHIKRDVSCIIWLFFLPKGSPWVLSNDDETGDSSYKEHRKTIKCNSVANNMKLVHKKLVNLGIYFTAVN